MYTKTINSFKDIEYPYSEKYLNLNDGTKICYIDEGKGSPILFIHGMGGDLTNWSNCYEYFEKSHRCIGIDLPGYGKSGKLDNGYTIKKWALIIEEFLEILNINKCMLIGNSMGGLISIILTDIYPKKVDKLILVNSAGILPVKLIPKKLLSTTVNFDITNLPLKMLLDRGIKTLFYDQNNEDCKKFVNNIKQISQNNPREFNEYINTVKFSIREMLNIKIDSILSRINIPVLIIWGEKDKYLPIKIAQKFHYSIKNSKLMLIKNAGHLPMIEKSSKFNRIVDMFELF